MAVGYSLKDENTLTWLDNRDDVTLEIRQLMRRISNGVYAELSNLYVDALHRGEILEFNPNSKEIKDLVLKHTKLAVGEKSPKKSKSSNGIAV